MSKKSLPTKSIDISSHFLIPELTKLSDKEKEDLLSSFGIEFKELPKILAKDPSIKHLDASVGDVIKVSRKSETAGETIYYRGVVNA